MNRSRFCSECGVHWPMLPTTHECPLCERITTMSDEAALTPGQAADKVAAVTRERDAAEAERKRKYAEFERHCAERDEALVQELVLALDLLPTIDEPIIPEAPPIQNFGLGRGELGC